jgi:hypothetical protein
VGIFAVVNRYQKNDEDNSEKSKCSAVKCGDWDLAIELDLLVVTSFNSLINPVTNLNSNL